MLTNKIMSEKLGIPISKVRRNTKELLGEDPKATRRSGYKREFSLNEGFLVFLGGELVSRFNLSFGNARKALDVIKPWLLKNGLVPEPPKEAGREGIDDPDSEDPLTEVNTEFYVKFYLREGQISEICEVKIVAISDIYEDLEDSIGRKYNARSVNEHYYYFRNNQGKIEYFNVYTDSFKNPDSVLGERAWRIGLTVKDDEIKEIWKHSEPNGELNVSEMLADFLASFLLFPRF
jgi:hypothetical protein